MLLLFLAFSFSFSFFLSFFFSTSKSLPFVTNKREANKHNHISFSLEIAVSR